MKNSGKIFQAFLLTLAFALVQGKNIEDVKNDPLFAFREPKPSVAATQSDLTSSVTDVAEDQMQGVPKDRQLVLDYFKSSSDAQRTKALQNSMKKIVDILLLADTFKDDPTYNVNVKVVYKNENASQEENGADNSNNKVAKSRALSQDRSKSSVERLPSLDMAFLPGKAPVDPKPKSKFDFPKHFFKLL